MKGGAELPQLAGLPAYGEYVVVLNEVVCSLPLASAKRVFVVVEGETAVFVRLIIMPLREAVVAPKTYAVEVFVAEDAGRFTIGPVQKFSGIDSVPGLTRVLVVAYVVVAEEQVLRCKEGETCHPASRIACRACHIPVSCGVVVACVEYPFASQKACGQACPRLAGVVAAVAEVHLRAWHKGWSSGAQGYRASEGSVSVG